ncbi:MAG: serine--tRNA ligase [Thermoguttaceae bacterium]
MLDRRYILENVEQVKQNCVNRGMTVDVDRFVALETKRKTLQIEAEEVNRKANQVSKSIGKAKDEAEREARKEEGRRLRDQANGLKAELDEIVAEADVIHRMIPNTAHSAAPIGVDDKSNLELFKGKTPVPEFDFEPLDHVVLGEKLDLIDFEGGARVAGHGFYFLKNDLVLLELALQRYAVGVLMAEGFTPMTTPDLARNEILEGIGFNPRGEETQVYSIENTDLSLVATAEITLGGMLSGQTLDAEDLPLKFCGISHCFRTEAGAHGRETRGLYRVHQFTKIEMFAFTLPEQSDATLDHLRDLECRLFDGLGIPYRVVDTATGDLGAPAYRKFDLEAWMPGRGDYGEVTSTSNCTEYQSRRLNIRYRTKGAKGTKFVHTLNGTAIAISRGIIAIMENYQQADGSILVPEVLRQFVGKDRITG